MKDNSLLKDNNLPKIIALISQKGGVGKSITETKYKKLAKQDKELVNELLNNL